MLVREKVDAGQFEWYRDSKEIYYRLKHFRLRRFLLHQPEMKACIQDRLLCFLQKMKRKKETKYYEEKEF